MTFGLVGTGLTTNLVIAATAGADPGVIDAAYVGLNTTGTASDFAAAACIGATALVRPRAGVELAVAALQLGAVGTSGLLRVNGLVSFLALVAFVLWVLVTSGGLLRAGGEDGTGRGLGVAAT